MKQDLNSAGINQQKKQKETEKHGKELQRLNRKRSTDLTQKYKVLRDVRAYPL